MSGREELPSAPSDRPTSAERVWHFLSLLAVGSLFALYGLRRLFVDADGGSPGSLLLLAAQTLPLLVFLPGLLQGSARAAALLSFVSILYFGAGVLTLVDPASRLSGGAELFFATLLFVASAYYARQRGLRDAARAAPPPSSSEEGPPPPAAP